FGSVSKFPSGHKRAKGAAPGPGSRSSADSQITCPPRASFLPLRQPARTQSLSSRIAEMKWTPSGRSGNLEDRRSGGGLGRSLGIGGTVVVLALSLLTGRNLFNDLGVEPG